MTNEDLKGTIVMMHPELWAAHADPQGVIGEIVTANLVRDDFYVTYGGAQPHLHGSDALLVFKPAEEMMDFLRHHSVKLRPRDFQDLRSIVRMVHLGTPGHLRCAMELVRDNESIRRQSVRSLDEVLGLKLVSSLKR